MAALGTTLLLYFYLGVYYSSTLTLLEQQQQQQYPPAGVTSTSIINPIPTSSTITNTVGVVINGGTEKNTSDNAAATTTAAAVITDTTRTTTTTTILSPPPPSRRPPPLLLAYGTKDLKGRTAALVEQAIHQGFRQIVTCGHHVKHDEAATGVGIRHTSVPRAELFLQSCFVPVTNTQEFHFQPPPTVRPEAGKDPDRPTRSWSSVDEYAKLSIAEQVHASVQMSLQNLQTSYLDALVFHNFRAKVSNREHILQAWTVLEEYVESGIIHHLGLTSIHDPTWFADFYHHPRVRIKPTIVQNRFHANRQYDTGPMQDIFHPNNHNNKQLHYPNLQVQRFWVLNGSSGYGRKNRAMADTKGVTPEQLLLGFVMSMDETCLVGTTSVQHMQDDLRIAQCYPTLFDTEHERNEYAHKLGMHQQPPTQPLPGRRSDSSNDRNRNSSAACSNSS